LTRHFENNGMEECMDTIHFLKPKTAYDKWMPFSTHDMQNEMYSKFIEDHLREHYQR